MPAEQALAPRVQRTMRLLVMGVLSLGIVLATLAVGREQGQDPVLSTDSYLDTRGQVPSAPALKQALLEQDLGTAPSPNQFKDIINEQGSKALGGSFEEARSEAGEGAAKGGHGMQKFAADIKHMQSARSLFDGAQVHVSAGQAQANEMKQVAADMKNMLSARSLFDTVSVHPAKVDSLAIKKEMKDMQSMSEIRTYVGNDGAFIDKAKEEAKTLKKLALLHTQAKARLTGSYGSSSGKGSA